MMSIRPEGCLWRRKVSGPIQNIPGDTKMSIFRFGSTTRNCRLFRIIACAAASYFIFDYRHRGLNPRNFFENMNRLICKVALAFAFPGVCASAFGQNGADVNETAHLLAGMPVTGALTSFTQNSGWQAHAAAMDKAWKTKGYSQLGPSASWMSVHAGEYYSSSGTMYYMFTGPDVLYAYTCFPNANTYILPGLWPVARAVTTVSIGGAQRAFPESVWSSPLRIPCTATGSPESAVFCSSTAASSSRTTQAFLCAPLAKVGPSSSMGASFRTAKSSGNTIRRRWLKFTGEIRRLLNSASPSAIGGKQNAAFLCSRGANKRDMDTSISKGKKIDCAV